MARFAVLITFREVFGREPAVVELHEILKKYERREVVGLLAKLNCLLGTWQNSPQFNLDAALSKFLLRDYWGQIQTLRSSQAERILFSRITFLYVVKQACLTCPEEGLRVSGTEAWKEIGICCLMANDFLLPFSPSRTDATIEKLANLLPFADYISHDHYPMEIARTLMMIEEISQLASLRARQGYIELQAVFKGLVGIPHRTLCELVFACCTRFMQAMPEELGSSPEALVLRDTYFSRSRIGSGLAERFFAKLGISDRVLAQAVRDVSERPGDDLTVFQRFPLTRVADGAYVCLDPGFLLDKAGRGLYWTLFSEATQGMRAQLASWWGTVFEEYVNHVLNESYAAGGRFIPGPRFLNGDQAFDACLLEGADLIVFEHKSSVLRADAKYGGDTTRLADELQRKFVEGGEEGAKGLAQLSKSLVRFLEGNSIEGITAAMVRRVYPALVCLESSAAAPYMARYFAERFRAIYPRKRFRRVVVTPVFTLGISDVENLLGYLKSFKLSDIFESYHSENRAMLTPLSSSKVPLLKDAEPGRNIVREKFSKFADDMTMDLFGESAAGTG